jgi:hypothetical protein
VRGRKAVLGSGMVLASAALWFLPLPGLRDAEPPVAAGRAEAAASSAAPASPRSRRDSLARDAALHRLGERAADAEAEILLLRQHAPGEIAVCGQVAQPSGPAPFVVRVILPPGFDTEAGSAPRSAVVTVIEQAPGVPSVGRAAWPRYCQEPGSDVDAEPRVAAAPPAADLLHGAAAKAGPVEGGGAKPYEAVVRAPANLRDSPSGRAAILRVARPGEVMAILGYAPGGWVRVGDDLGPLGWVHASLLARHGP